MSDIRRPSNYAVDLECHLAAVIAGLVDVVQRQSGTLALAHGRRPCQRLAGGRSDAVDTAVQKATRGGALVSGDEMAVQSADTLRRRAVIRLSEQPQIYRNPEELRIWYDVKVVEK